MSVQKENNSLFRDKSLEQFTAPEQLNDYIRVIRPSLILVLVAIIVLLCGIVLWGYFGSIDSHEDVTCVVNDGLIHTYISSSLSNEISNSSTIMVSDKEYKIRTISNELKAGVLMDDAELAYFQLDPNDYVIVLSGDCDLPDGSYQGKVIMARIRPISLILG
ncbi:MAG: hypothetical protein IKE28_04090 [Solobacterium sp.]|nr:hypothetical protein [Solobacterium sp.]